MLSEAILCMALNIYHEARGEPFVGQVAVAEVMRRRMLQPFWPSTACDVVYQPYQFSWTINYTEKVLDEKQLLVAYEAAMTPCDMPYMDHYHTIDIMPPDWADDMEVVTVIGNHIFYRSI